MSKEIPYIAADKYFGFLENRLKENGTRWCVGDGITIADLRVYYVAQIMIGSGILDGIPPESHWTIIQIQRRMFSWFKQIQRPRHGTWYT